MPLSSLSCDYDDDDDNDDNDDDDDDVDEDDKDDLFAVQVGSVVRMILWQN